MFPHHEQKTRLPHTGELSKDIAVNPTDLTKQESLLSAKYHTQKEQLHTEKRAREAIDALLAMAETLMHLPHHISHEDDTSGEIFVASMIGQRIVEISHTILDFQRVGIIAVDPETEHLRPVAVVGLSPEEETSWFSKTAHLSLLDILLDPNLVKLLHAKEVLLLDMTHPLFQNRPNPYNIHTMLVAPICVKQQLIGILYSNYVNKEHTYTHEDLSIIKTITKLAALVIEREQAEAERSHTLFALQRANEQLSKINSVQSNFVSVVSYEFRTTLTSIQGFSELIRDEDFSDAEVKEYATDINSNALLLDEMIGELLDLERLKSGRIQLRHDPVNLNSLLNRIINSIASITHHHTFYLQLDDAIPPLLGDQDKLIQVTTNLISNSVKYSPSGGEIFVCSHLEDGLVHISIQDHGIGIPSHALEQIFAPYYRVEAESSRYITGTGLGLSIVRQIIEMHSGHVWAESTPGQGSTFHFTLPLAGHSPV